MKSRHPGKFDIRWTGFLALVVLSIFAGCDGLFSELPEESDLRDRPIAVSAGAKHTCAIGSQGTIYCWGSNDRARLGDGSGESDGSMVVPNRNGKATAVSAGDNHSCAIFDGQVHCWGASGAGQTGQDGHGDDEAPQPVDGIDAPTPAVSVGLYFSCGIDAEGPAMCWGSNADGQLGRGEPLEGRNPIPMLVEALGPVNQISAGGATYTRWFDRSGHACAVSANAEVWCWGANDYGQLGDGSTDDSSVPVRVEGIGGGARSVCAGGLHSCAVSENGSAWCWGSEHNGKLGNDKMGLIADYQAQPVRVEGVDDAREITCGRDFSCAITDGGQLLCWGANRDGQLGNGQDFDASGIAAPVSGLENVVEVSGGLAHACAIDADAQLYCWGHGEDYQLGDQNEADRNTPVPVEWPE